MSQIVICRIPVTLLWANRFNSRSESHLTSGNECGPLICERLTAVLCAWEWVEVHPGLVSSVSLCPSSARRAELISGAETCVSLRPRKAGWEEKWLFAVCSVIWLKVAQSWPARSCVAAAVRYFLRPNSRSLWKTGLTRTKHCVCAPRGKCSSWQKSQIIQAC